MNFNWKSSWETTRKVNMTGKCERKICQSVTSSFKPFREHGIFPSSNWSVLETLGVSLSLHFSFVWDHRNSPVWYQVCFDFLLWEIGNWESMYGKFWLSKREATNGPRAIPAHIARDEHKQESSLDDRDWLTLCAWDLFCSSPGRCNYVGKERDEEMTFEGSSGVWELCVETLLDIGSRASEIIAQV